MARRIHKLSLMVITLLCLGSYSFAVTAQEDISQLINPTNPAVSVEDMFNKVNALRQNLGRTPLTLVPALTTAAQEQADFISNTGNYAHVHGGTSPRTRALAVGYQTTEWCCSENTHRTQVGRSAWEFWNYSQSHFYNMINPKWTEIGVATSSVGSWTGWVLVFGSGVVQPPPTPIAETPAQETAAPQNASDAPEEDTVYRILPGDTLFSIATHFGTSVQRLREVNGITGDLIYAGATLIIPTPAAAT